jgi:glycosyltransferase involved in cell wall biosynthesis
LKKALILASVASMIDQFNMSNIEILRKMDFEIQVAANFKYGSNTSQERVNIFKSQLISMGVIVHDITFDRNAFSFINIKAYNDVKNLINKENFNLIHCHSPIGGLIARMAARKARNNGTKIIYTAHGFHFFKGAPLNNWLIYYPIEKFLARYNDVLITINHEDYKRAKKSFRTKKIEYIPGVGIDTIKISNITVDRKVKREEIRIAEDAFAVLSVGELNKNKNHEAIIRALSKIKNENIVYVICGTGMLENYLRSMAEKLNVKVKFLGYRNDVLEICKVCDLFVFPSRREGLGLSALESMASGLPIVTSNIHGIKDYSKDGVTGYSCSPTDFKAFAFKINSMLNDSTLRKQMGERNKAIVKQFDISVSKGKVAKIYREIMNEQVLVNSSL